MNFPQATNVVQLVGAWADTGAGARSDGQNKRLADLDLVGFQHLTSRKLQGSQGKVGQTERRPCDSGVQARAKHIILDPLLR